MGMWTKRKNTTRRCVRCGQDTKAAPFFRGDSRLWVKQVGATCRCDEKTLVFEEVPDGAAFVFEEQKA